jgi:hypothetical protein
MIQKNILLILGFVLIMSGLKAQEIFGTSDSLAMNFGYPVIEVIDDLKLIDENENNHIDPGETISISFTIKNIGKYIAKSLSIHPQELNNIAGLSVPESFDVGDIPPGEDRLIQVIMSALDDLEEGSANFIFRVHENGKYGDDISATYVVGTGKKE